MQLRCNKALISKGLFKKIKRTKLKHSYCFPPQRTFYTTLQFQNYLYIFCNNLTAVKYI